LASFIFFHPQREMILGDEARAKVPPEFQVQQPDIANPPTFFLVVNKMLKRIRELKSNSPSAFSPYNSILSSEDELELLTEFLRRSYPRLRAFYRFYYQSQFGVELNTFRWRGRTENHTFASGLDDYPRSRYVQTSISFTLNPLSTLLLLLRVPDETEMHLDLLCWLAMSSNVMKEVAVFLQDQPDPFGRPPPVDIIDFTLKYSGLLESLESKHLVSDPTFSLFFDISSFLSFPSDYHWDPVTELYSDVEVYNKNLKKVVKRSSHVGYVSLFPLLFGLIPADSPRLIKILERCVEPPFYSYIRSGEKCFLDLIKPFSI
jgi:mannosyl-oligosaccharide glucosidase